MKKNKWVPKIDEPYYFVNSFLEPSNVPWWDDEHDKERYRIGNCFRTKREAQIMANKFKKLLKEG
jgi:hypothetical protein